MGRGRDPNEPLTYLQLGLRHSSACTMKLLTYLGGITVALLLAFSLPSHLLTVREEMRSHVTESKSFG